MQMVPLSQFSFAIHLGRDQQLVSPPQPHCAQCAPSIISHHESTHLGHGHSNIFQFSVSLQPLFSKMRALQAISFTNISPRARTGIVIFSITFFSGLFLWYTNAHRIDDLAAYYRTHFPGASDISDSSYGSLEHKLAYQEDQYQEYLKGRQGLIKKWGPTIEQVQTFPKNGQFYTMWDFFIPAFSCPFPVTRTGQLGDGGKFVCGLDRVIKRPNCLIYSLGVEGDSSFEAEILRRSSTCQIHGFDYSVSKVNEFPNSSVISAHPGRQWGPEISNEPTWAPRVNFKPWKISSEDKHDITPPEHTIQSLFAANGSSHALS